MNLPNGWIKKGEKLMKNFTFPDFKQALNWVCLIGEIADQLDHHPDVLLTYGKVEVSCWTHDSGGVTDKDFQLANQIESLSTRSNGEKMGCQ